MSLGCVVPTRGAVGERAGGRRPKPQRSRPQARGRSREARARAAPDLFGGGWAAPQAVTSCTLGNGGDRIGDLNLGAGGWGPYPNFLISPHRARSTARSAPDAAATPPAQPSDAQRNRRPTRKTGRASEGQKAKQPRRRPAKQRQKHDKARHTRKRGGELCRGYARFTPIPAPNSRRSELRPARR